MTGKVVALINSPCVCDEIVLKVGCKEKIHWIDEHVHHRTEGEGEHQRTITTYTYDTREAKDKVWSQEITVSKVDHILPPGQWQYPFSYQIPASVPGVMKYKKKEKFHNPDRRGEDRETKVEVSYKVKATLKTAGAFSRELKAKSDTVVNSFFDWSKMTPQTGENAG